MIPFTNPQYTGFLPQFLSELDPRGAVEQIDAHYQHGGGWHDFEGFALTGNSEQGYALEYPEDPPMLELSRAQLRDETIVLFQYEWVAVIQSDGAFRVARID